jgi:hypothetical protein
VRSRLAWWGSSKEMKCWHRRLAAFFVMLVLAGCAQGVAGRAQAPNARLPRSAGPRGPYSPENNGNMHDSGGGGGDGGSM